MPIEPDNAEVRLAALQTLLQGGIQDNDQISSTHAASGAV